MNNYCKDIVLVTNQYRYLLFALFFQSVLFGLIFLSIGRFPIYRAGITYLWIFWYALGLFFLLNSLFFVIGCIIAGKEKPTLTLLNYHWSKLSDGIFVTHFVMTTFVFMLSIFIFSSIKSSIPIIIPFWADPYFVDFDRILFLGNMPHEFFGFLIKCDGAIIALNFVYNFWLIFVILVMLFISLTSDNELRLHILHASVISWFIAGNWMAVIFSSVGPVFYEEFFGDNLIYAPLMENLEAINLRTGMVWALNAQRGLLLSYSHPESPISGISAMPSMHVLFAFIIAFAAMKVGRFAAVAGYLFAILILIGSVVLGWHYAVDGVAGVLAAIVFWKISHPITLRAIGRMDSV